MGWQLHNLTLLYNDVILDKTIIKEKKGNIYMPFEVKEQEKKAVPYGFRKVVKVGDDCIKVKVGDYALISPMVNPAPIDLDEVMYYSTNEELIIGVIEAKKWKG